MNASLRIGGTRRNQVPLEQRGSKREPEREQRDWIGVDFSSFATSQPSRALLPLLFLALIVALGVASLRIDLIRTRYALAAAMETEQRLIEEQHELIVEKLQGRDPVELAVLAAERGFRPTPPTISLADPMPIVHRPNFGFEAIDLPAVATAPPDRADRSNDLAGAAR